MDKINKYYQKQAQGIETNKEKISSIVGKFIAKKFDRFGNKLVDACVSLDERVRGPIISDEDYYVNGEYPLRNKEKNKPKNKF
ncbi:MAG: hypothetical protein KKF48_01575 [Nanoarchaeota archaeon]|nr:hypothetical protein [Nanoarchaeota archaeon]MBU1027711.1 hypothetical protein [Nanoarchaeota archaeon]